MLNLAWLLTSILLGIGFCSPMFTFTHFYFFNDTFSLINGIFHLAYQGEYILFALLLMFSIVMPIIKMLMLLYTINRTTVFSHVQQLRLNRLAKLSKWSMLDVYVIAILAVTVKLGMIATVSIHYGLIAFAISVTLSMALPWWISLSHRRSKFTNKKADSVPLLDDNYASNAIMLNAETLQKLRDAGTLALEIEPECKALLIDIFNEKSEWQAKGNIEHRDGQTILMLIAYREIN